MDVAIGKGDSMIGVETNGTGLVVYRKGGA